MQNHYGYVGDREITLNEFNEKAKSTKFQLGKIYRSEDIVELLELLKNEDILVIVSFKDIINAHHLKIFLKLSHYTLRYGIRIISIDDNYDMNSNAWNKARWPLMIASFTQHILLHPPLLVNQEKLNFYKMVMQKEDFLFFKSCVTLDKIENIDFTRSSEIKL